MARGVLSAIMVTEMLSVVECFGLKVLPSPPCSMLCQHTCTRLMEFSVSRNTLRQPPPLWNRVATTKMLSLSVQNETPDESQTMPNRKERRRMNRRNRNNQRNRLTTESPTGETSIARKKSLSQNFLVDDATIMSLVSCVDDTSEMGCAVVELGPGLGSLTRYLLERYPKMKAVELDGQAVSALKTSYPDLDVTEESLLDFDFKKHYEDRGEKLTVISNVPFGISSSTLYKLLENSMYIRRAVLVLQQEVIDRIMSGPTQRKYGSLSIEHAIRAENIQQEMTIPPAAFDPPPKQTKIGFWMSVL
eukprot:757269-Hanusia_phi.AAC.11